MGKTLLFYRQNIFLPIQPRAVAPVLKTQVMRAILIAMGLPNRLNPG